MHPLPQHSRHCTECQFPERCLSVSRTLPPGQGHAGGREEGGGCSLSRELPLNVAAFSIRISHAAQAYGSSPSQTVFIRHFHFLMASPGSLPCVLTATEVSQAARPSPEGVLPLLLPGPENLSTLVSRVFLLRAKLCSWVSPQQGAQTVSPAFWFLPPCSQPCIPQNALQGSKL